MSAAAPLANRCVSWRSTSKCNIQKSLPKSDYVWRGKPRPSRSQTCSTSRPRKTSKPLHVTWLGEWVQSKEIVLHRGFIFAALLLLTLWRSYRFGVDETDSAELPSTARLQEVRRWVENQPIVHVLSLSCFEIGSRGPASRPRRTGPGWYRWRNGTAAVTITDCLSSTKQQPTGEFCF